MAITGRCLSQPIAFFHQKKTLLKVPLLEFLELDKNLPEQETGMMVRINSISVSM